MSATRAVSLLSVRRLPHVGIGLMMLASAAVAAMAGASPPPAAAPAPAPPLPGPQIRGDLFYPAPNAAPFQRGTAPGVWVRDVPPDPVAAPASPLRLVGPDGKATGFYNGRMTYTMPDGRTVAGASSRRWPKVKPSVKACVKPAAAKKPAVRRAAKAGRK
jgi:hypothetical protein